MVSKTFYSNVSVSDQTTFSCGCGRLGTRHCFTSVGLGIY